MFLTVRNVWHVVYNVDMYMMKLLFVHKFANMYGAFDVILYFVNPTFSCQ